MCPLHTTQEGCHTGRTAHEKWRWETAQNTGFKDRDKDMEYETVTVLGTTGVGQDIGKGAEGRMEEPGEVRQKDGDQAGELLNWGPQTF